MEKYVLTGPPGSGKSSIILALELACEYVVFESAEDYIRLRQSQGQPTPWIEPDFQDQILNLQLQREGRIPKDVTRVFLDRGVHDGLAYATKNTPTYNRLEELAELTRYDKIFFIEPLETIDTNGVRREDKAQALALEKRLVEVYNNFGYSPIAIPNLGVDERRDLLLDYVRKK